MFLVGIIPVPGANLLANNIVGMREIKFRGWNKNEKKMCKVNRIDYLLKEVILDGFPAPMNDVLYFREVELMQYTGLKDKNGKEIYESDILRDTDGDYIEMTWRESIEPFPIVYWGDIDDYEVVGNIYENPELLTN